MPSWRETPTFLAAANRGIAHRWGSSVPAPLQRRTVAGQSRGAKKFLAPGFGPSIASIKASDEPTQKNSHAKPCHFKGALIDIDTDSAEA